MLRTGVFSATGADCGSLLKKFDECQTKLDEALKKCESCEKECSEFAEKAKAAEAKAADFDKVDGELKAYKKQEFLSQAKALIDSAKLENDTAASLYADCEKGVFTTIDGIKTKVASAYFDQNTKKNQIVFAAPVAENSYKPSVVKGPAEGSASGGLWERIGDYVGDHK